MPASADVVNVNEVLPVPMLLMFMKNECYSNAIGKCYNHTIGNVIDVQSNLLVCYIYPFGINWGLFENTATQNL
jgi:hypothetical protein